MCILPLGLILHFVSQSTSSYLAHHFLLCPFPGVIATHRITASSPDTDLPTVAGLRVRRHVSAQMYSDV